MDRAVVTIPGFQEITQIVRTLHPLSAWIGAEPVRAIGQDGKFEAGHLPEGIDTR
jgi:hypothetical protein